MSVESLFPIVVSADLPRLVRFYEDAFGAVVTFRFPGADGEDDYVSLRLGADAALGLGRDPAATGGGPFSLWLYVDDVDAAYAAALDAGASAEDPPTDREWGERVARLRDVDGNLVNLGARAATAPPAP